MGQGHKRWCKVKCGEKDVDWEVKFISEERGKGMVAKRDFAAGERVLVERVFTLDEIAEGGSAPAATRAAFMELEPAAGSLSDKFQLNSVGVQELAGAAVGLNLSRVNHDCRANCTWWFDETDVSLKNLLLVTDRPVAAGEEFTITYATSISLTQARKPPALVAALLTGKWGIRCPADCVCKNAALLARAEAGHRMDSDIYRLGTTGRIREAFGVAQDLLRLHEELGSPDLDRLRTMNDYISTGIAQQKTAPLAIRMMRRAHKIALAILGPHSVQTLKYERLVKDPSTHHNHYSRA